MNPYPIDNLWKRGHYLQRVNGPNDTGKFGGVDRSLVTGRPIKSRGVVEYSPKDVEAPAWVIRGNPGTPCGECGTPTPFQELIAATPIGWIVVGTGFTSKELLALWDAGLPGSDPIEQVADVLATLAEQAAQREPAYAGEKETPF